MDKIWIGDFEEKVREYLEKKSFPLDIIDQT